MAGSIASPAGMTPAPASQPAPGQVGPPAAWGTQTSFFQVRQPAFWLFVMAMIVGGVLTLQEELGYLASAPVAWFLSLALLALYAIPVFLVVYLADLFEREPISLLAAALAWGFVVVGGLATPTNGALSEILQKLFGSAFVSDWGPAVTGPLVEETLKFLGVAVILLVARAEIDDVFDGFIYGAMVGLGFAVNEDIFYFVNSAVAGGTVTLGPLFGSFFVRVIASGLYGHVLYTGLSGMGLAYYETRRDQPHQRRVLVAVLAFAGAILAHFLWNSPIISDVIMGRHPTILSFIPYGLIKGLPFLLFILFLLRLAQQRERRWFDSIVAKEVGTDSMTAQEQAALGGLRSRRAARKAALLDRGPAAEKLVGRLQREQIELGLTHTRVADPNHPELQRHRDAIRSIRAELAGLPVVQRLPAAGFAPAGAFAAQGQPQRYTATQQAAAPAWAPTHRVPAGGMPAWPAPDPSLPPGVMLAERLDLRLVERAGDWAHVVASNGWSGWVDARRLAQI